MGQNNMKADNQGVNNIIAQQVNTFHAGVTTNNQAGATTNNQSDKQYKLPQNHVDQLQLPPPYEASCVTATWKTPTLTPLDKRYCSLNRPHDVILHAGRYVLTDTYNGRIVAFRATSKVFSVLYEAKGRNLPFRPFSIVALSDMKDSFLITDLHHNTKKGFVYKLEDKKLTPFSSTFNDFRTPTGIALNRKRDRVYIADSARKCILEYAVDGTYLGQRGQGNLIDPWFIACNSQDNIYVTDHEGIKVFDANWKYLETVTINLLGRPWCYRGIAIDASNNIFITARSRSSVGFLTNETVAVINANHKLVNEYTGGIWYHNYLRGVCINSDMNRVVVVNGEKHMIEIYSLY